MCKQQLVRALELLNSCLLVCCGSSKIKGRESILLKGQSYHLCIVTLVTTSSRQTLYSAFSCFTSCLLETVQYPTHCDLNVCCTGSTSTRLRRYVASTRVGGGGAAPEMVMIYWKICHLNFI